MTLVQDLSIADRLLTVGVRGRCYAATMKLSE
jgi:hypothetical protein